MDIKTYRARSMHEALRLVRRELGPEAAVLHTREVRSSRLFGLIQQGQLEELSVPGNAYLPSFLAQDEDFRASGRTHAHGRPVS